MDFLNAIAIYDIGKAFYQLLGISLLLFVVWLMVRLVKWSKKMPKGALVMLAVLPVLSIFPIPAQEIKKIERIKQQQVQEEEESGDPLDKNDLDD